MNKDSRKWFIIFVAPALFAFIVVVLIPVIMGIIYSFTSWNGIEDKANWIGLSNYIEIIKDDKTFFSSFLFTAKFAIVSVITINVMGFVLALLVTRGLKISNGLRGIFFLPNLIGGLILGFIWQFIFTKGFDFIGAALGIDFLRGWLADPTTGFWGLVILMSWQMSGYMMVIYISGLQNIPDDIIEAAKIDGASDGQILRRIIIPLVSPAFTIGIFLTLSNSFKLYDQNLSLTAGGPYNSTEMIAMNIYNSAFKYNEFGIAQAKAVIFLIIIAAITLTQMYYSKKREVEM
ncbi:Lactose transport system permease protein LacF [Clostridium liquoris]|jgi:raffinose/stachyose/melibiose transport system permease protein|uniref:Lactose transport system permease protein LacF n=1 Tax=Clostridium liquoris TaxID=1289519 RepID=A0A2T0B291_9CLOT|nr:sugar ABC transporter permease [Clostridium liquoris]PRR77808.1 Lactose transport system permease protein LacF [Clostridium liquoris]